MSDNTEADETEPFANLPDDVPAEYLSGAAAFVRSGGDVADEMSKTEYVWVLNQLCGIERVDGNDGDGRASQSAVPADEAENDEAESDALHHSDYTDNVFEAELSAWANELLPEDGD